MLTASNVFNGSSKEGYYLNFNRDQVFINLIASEGHFRNFKSLKEDSTGFLNCIVKHLADAEGHCDEAVSHALIAENSETSRRFLELRDEIRSFRKWIQISPITRDDGIREIRKLRRSFEGFNPDYDVSKCETCGDSEEIMRDITKIIGDIKNNSHPIAAHEVNVEDFLVMEREMAEKVILKLSEKYGVEPPELVISDECHEPEIGLYTLGRIMVCKTGINLHVICHEFMHHLQAQNGMHMDEGEAEKFAIELFASPQKGLYAFHSSSHNERKMVEPMDRTIGLEEMNVKDVGIIYVLNGLGFAADYGIKELDTRWPEGFWGQSVSFWGELGGAVLGFVGAVKLPAPLNLVSAMIGSYLTTELIKQGIRMYQPERIAVRPRVYTPPMRYISPPAVGTPPVAVGRYQVT